MHVRVAPRTYSPFTLADDLFLHPSTSPIVLSEFRSEFVVSLGPDGGGAEER